MIRIVRKEARLLQNESFKGAGGEDKKKLGDNLERLS